MKVVSVEQMRQIEAAVDQSLMSYERMMLAAGGAASEYLQSRFTLTEKTRITVLVGKGNNGGDGLVAAVHLARHSACSVRIYLLEGRDESDSHYAAALAEGLFIARYDQDRDLRLLRSLIISADVILDALFGIGLRLPLRGDAARLLRAVNQTLRKTDQAGAAPATEDMITLPPANGRPFVLAIDCPSGIDCDSGAADPAVLSADATITFIAAKPGLFNFPAATHVGELALARLGIPADFPPLRAIRRSITDARAAAAILPARPGDGHKGSFGKAIVVAGCANYVGAVALSATAAYRAGAGLVTVATTGELTRTLSGALREPTYLPLAAVDGCIAEANSERVAMAAEGYSALLIGCGLGTHASTKGFVRQLLGHESLPPLIVDADALNILSEIEQWWRMLPAGTIITPHLGEMARLCGLANADVAADRWALATSKAEQWGVIVALKGAHTIVARPGGEASVIPVKTDALATAGTGDVLAGLMAGLRAQGGDAWDVARLGCYVHALAGIKAAETIGSGRSVIAGDVLAELGAAFQSLESG